MLSDRGLCKDPDGASARAASGWQCPSGCRQVSPRAGRPCGGKEEQELPTTCSEGNEQHGKEQTCPRESRPLHEPWQGVPVRPPQEDPAPA